MRIAWLAGSCLLACTSLPPIAVQVCGNGLVETENGEDCDTVAGESGAQCGAAGDGVRQCRFLCSKTNDLPACPSGFACGSDRICRQAVGAYANVSGSPFNMKVAPFTVADMDGDGNSDLVGASVSGISVRFATPDADFSAASDFPANLPPQRPVVADLDGDGRMDVVAPLLVGFIVARGQRDRSLSPVAFPQIEVNSALDRGSQLIALDAGESFPSDDLVQVVTDGLNINFLFAPRSFEDAATNLVMFPETHVLLDVAGRIPIANVHSNGENPSDEFAIPFLGAESINVYGLARDVADRLGVVVLQEISLPGSVAPEGASFGDIDADGNLDLVVAVVPADDEEIFVAVARGDGAGHFDVASIDPRFDDLIRPPGGCGDTLHAAQGRVPLAIADFDQNGETDYVSDSAVVLSRGALLCPVFWGFSQYPWTEAVATDLNRDGTLDAAAISGMDNGVDLAIGSGQGLFTGSRVVTNRIPTRLRSGDFDGDRQADLVVQEHGQADTGERDFLSVLFGDADVAIGDFVGMGEFARLEALEVANLAVPFVAADSAADLLVLEKGTDSRSYAFLIGTSARLLESPLLLVEHLSELGETSELQIVYDLEAGHFDPSDDEWVDIVAVTDKGIWLVPGSRGIGFRTSASTFVAVPEFIAHPLGLDSRCGSWGAVDLDGDGRAEVVGIASADCSGEKAATLLVGRVEGTKDAPSITLTARELNTELRGLHRLVIADIDEKQGADLLVIFSGVLGEHAGTLVVWNSGGELDPETPSLVSAFDGKAAVAVNADGEAGSEILLLTNQGIALSKLRDRTFTPPQLVVKQPGLQNLLAADVDHDGLSDLIAEDGVQVHVLRALSAQEAAIGPETSIGR